MNENVLLLQNSLKPKELSTFVLSLPIVNVLKYYFPIIQNVFYFTYVNSTFNMVLLNE